MVFPALPPFFPQFCTRALGAALISAFLALRLLSAVVGSIVMVSAERLGMYGQSASQRQGGQLSSRPASQRDLPVCNARQLDCLPAGWGCLLTCRAAGPPASGTCLLARLPGAWEAPFRSGLAMGEQGARRLPLSCAAVLKLLSRLPPAPLQLNETPNKAITWVGLGIVGVTTAGFVVAQHQHKQRKAAQAAAAAAAADEEAARQAAEEGRSGGELVPQAAGWSSFMSHGASFLRGPRSFLGDSAATFRRRQLRAKSAPSRVSFMAALGHSTDTGYSPELLLQRDLEDSDDESECEGAIGSDGKGGGEGGGSPASSKPASSA